MCFSGARHGLTQSIICVVEFFKKEFWYSSGIETCKMCEVLLCLSTEVFQNMFWKAKLCQNYPKYIRIPLKAMSHLGRTMFQWHVKCEN